jgi:formylglycine-generating enzyme required for sulfatase activity
LVGRAVGHGGTRGVIGGTRKGCPYGVARTVATPAAGAIWINPKDGAEYVYVPAGPFIMGSSDRDSSALDTEKPQQTDLALDAFWIMRTEVTNVQYNRCVRAGVCRKPGSLSWDDPTYAEYPVILVTWYQANEYAQWVGGRLPTEAEWEKACRGTDGRIYPWGNATPTSELANFGMNVGDTMPVGSYPDGASPYSALDMAGNVWEWTSTKWVDAYKNYQSDDSLEGSERRVLRGGSFYDYDWFVRCAARDGSSPNNQIRRGVFRVVLSP